MKIPFLAGFWLNLLKISYFCWKSAIFAENQLFYAIFSLKSLFFHENPWFSMIFEIRIWWISSYFSLKSMILGYFSLNLMDFQDFIVDLISTIFWLNSIEFSQNSIEFDENPIIWWKSLIFHQIIVDISSNLWFDDVSSMIFGG